MEGRIENLRIGIGSDIHRLGDTGKPLVLGGVPVPHPDGLGPVAHSDGDAVIHALIDAISGPAGTGDIGEVFPDTDPEFSGADSSKLLSMYLERCSEIEILSVDMIVTCDRPGIAPFKAAIRSHLAALLGIEIDRVNLKGKTWEGLLKGTEAVCVQASVLVRVGG